MLIGNNWKVESANLNVILYRRKKRVRKETKEVYLDWEVVGYFAKVEGALRELVNQGVRDTQLKDLRTVVAKIKELETSLIGLSVPLQSIAGSVKG